MRKKAGMNVGPQQCSTKTSGGCMMGGCAFWRGATDCEMFKCVCQPGHCVDEFGGCYKSMGLIRAEVVPIHATQPKFPGVPVVTALCVSGGGSRALSAALGSFRALRDLGLLPSIDAISSVSGGSWASAILMFAKMDLETLLGPATTPSALSLVELDKIPAPLGNAVTAKINDIAISLKLSGVPFGMLWVASVAKAFLEPFGLNRFDTYLAPSLAAVEQIKLKNPQFKDAAFQVPTPGRAKTIIMNAAILSPESFKASADDVVNLQVSPDFTGSPFYPHFGSAVDAQVSYQSANVGDKPLTKVLIGGGLVSTYAYGGSAPTNRGLNGQMGGEDVEMQSPTRPMCLARAVGMSSAAFGGQMSGIPGIGAETNPRVEIWPVSSDEHPKPQKAMRFMIGDGGNLENTGVLAALQRGASRVVALINGPNPVVMTPSFCDPPAGYIPTGAEITAQFANLFGYGDVENSQQEFHKYNEVFLQSDYLPMLCEFQKLKASGKPITLRKTMQVQPNSWWGIIGPRSTDFLFAILEKSEAFEESLPSDTRQALAQGSAGGVPDFPLMQTTFYNPPDLTYWTPRQINLLAAQTEYAVRQNAELFKAVLR